jgi:hypothetical protein
MEMQESRQIRRANLARAIKRRRDLLYVLEIAGEKLPLAAKERHARMIPRVREELRQMEIEYHDLNVQQIREESESG